MSIRLEQTQKQMVSQKLIQSVNILQMSTQELADYIKEATLENPVLDFDERMPEDKDQERLRKLEWLMSRTGLIISMTGMMRKRKRA